MNSPATLTSIQVGLPQRRGDPAATDPCEQEWYSGFVKEPVTGPVYVSKWNLDGDGQADLRVHGGIDKAVLAYSADHYPLWREELELDELLPGGFGENLTITGLSEANVCIGDVYQIGDVTLEVSQPRQPCWKLSRRWGRGDLPKRVIQSGRTGWYFRVLTEGHLTAGDDIKLIVRPHPDWPLNRCHRAMFDKSFDTSKSQELMEIPQVADAWRDDLELRIRRID